jgi:CRISPR-associated endonuclease Csn1
MKSASKKLGGDIWSFDIGLGSIGEAIRDPKTHEFKHVASLVLPAEFASTKTAATTRRMFRTRLAHKKREEWLDHVWRGAEQEPLKRRTTWRNPKTGKFELKHPGDPRLEREFPAKGDETCYTSCLLRIKLLRGEKLEPWQIYKALHSAIQRRGYDPDIPWKAKSASKASVEELKEQEEDEAKLLKFEQELRAMTKDEAYQLPCYFDAWKMGLWNPQKPDKLSLRIDCTAESPRNHVIPRTLVEKELKLLTVAAAKALPKLKGKEDYLLYGPAGRPYASWYPDFRKQHGLRLGSHTDTQGVLSQRIPRFDNRIISKCALIPRLNVCKITAASATAPAPQSEIVFDAVFLLKLKNMRVAQPNGDQRGLAADEIRTIFEDPKRKTWSFTAKQWARAIAHFGLVPVAGHEEIKAPRTAGRSRFCRPALEILKRLILSGQSPKVFYAEELARLGGNKDPLKGVVPEDLEFLLKMGDSWDRIHVPDQQLDAVLQMSSVPEQAVRLIIGKQNNPVVRHRLQLFFDRLKHLKDRFGEPQTVALEFVRWDFMGEKARKEYSKFVSEQTKLREQARKEAEEAGLDGKGAALKLALFKEQGGICLYTGEPLDISKIDSYEIDHIVPHSRMGPDAPYNRVLTTRSTNKDLKKDKTPFEWLGATSGWESYLERVKGRAGQLRNRKVRLLTSQDAEDLVEKYTTLAETAWISRLARAVLDATFGWRNGVDRDGKKRVVFVQGGLTARIRRKYRLNSLLAPTPEGVDARDWESKAEKNRTDKRHHALDAMVINFVPQWARDEAKESFFKFPKALGTDPRTFFAGVIDETSPLEVAFEKSVLADGIFGGRSKGPERFAVQRSPLLDLGYSTQNQKRRFDTRYLCKQVQSICDKGIREHVAAHVTTHTSEAEWNSFCANYRLKRRSGGVGPRVVRVAMKIGSLEHYADLSKDRSGSFRQGKKRHKGQLIYRNATLDSLEVMPIYAHASFRSERIRLQNEPGNQVLAFVQSGCRIQTHAPISSANYKLVTISADRREKRITPTQCLAADIYTWRTIDSRTKSVEIESRRGQRLALPLRHLVNAGFSRASAISGANT